MSPSQASVGVHLKLRLIHNNPEVGLDNKVNNSVLRGFHNLCEFTITKDPQFNGIRARDEISCFGAVFSCQLFTLSSEDDIGNFVVSVDASKKLSQPNYGFK